MADTAKKITTKTLTQLEVSYGTRGGEQRYIAPILFPRLREIRKPDVRRRYVLERLKEMVAEGDLSLTDLLNQPPAVRDMVGMILKQVVWDKNTKTQRVAQPFELCPPEVGGYPITIRCITGRAESVRFTRSRMPHPEGDMRALRGARSGKDLGFKAAESDRVADDIPWGNTMEIIVDEIVDSGNVEATLTLHDAWICMAQEGYQCCNAPSLSRQRRKWKYFEVGHDFGDNHDPTKIK